MSSLTDWVNASPARQRKFAQERLITDVAEEIWGAMRVNGVTKADLAKALGCSKSHITQILNGRRNMTLRSLADICFHLKLQPSLLLRRVSSEGGAPREKTGAPDCEKCAGEGWCWGHQLDNPNEDTYADSMTRYSCDGAKCVAMREAAESAANECMSKVRQHFDERRESAGFTQEQWAAMPCAGRMHNTATEFHTPDQPCPLPPLNRGD